MNRSMKKHLAWILSLALLLACLPQLAPDVRAEEPAASGTCGENLTWSFDAQTGTLTIEGSGRMNSYGIWYEERDPPWDEFEDDICVINLPEELTTIGEFAFAGTAIESIRLPGGITSIGYCAFFQCQRLKSVSFPEALQSIGDSAFGITGLKQLLLPKSLKSIGAEAFENCSQLDTVILPAGLETVGAGAFHSCKKLKTFILDSGMENFSIDSRGVLYNKDKTELICCPAGISGKLVVPEGVKTIASGAIYGCNQLFDVVIPEGVETLGSAAFSACTSLRTVHLPASVKSISYNVFAACSEMTAIWVAEDNENYYSDSFGVVYSKVYKDLCCFPCGLSGYYNVPEGIEKIDYYACAYAKKLTGISLPSSLETIHGYAFQRCSSLSSVSFSSGLKEIEYSAFAECSALKEATLPASVQTIDTAAFCYCKSLASITVLNPDCAIYDSDATMSSCDSTKLIGYPDSTTQAYAEKYGYTFIDINSGESTDYQPGENVDPELPNPVPLSDEVTHLIFADMAYRISSDCRGKTVAEWLSAKTYLHTPKEAPGNNEDEMTRPAFRGSEMNRIQIYSMVGDWTIADFITGEVGYAAAVFRKGNDYIIAYRGSEGGPQSAIFEHKDWRVDMEFALFNFLDPGQFSAALETYNRYNKWNNHVTLTGHSLGGALVAYVSIVTGAKGYSFDGAAGHVVDLTYLLEPMKINFTSRYQIPFTNYTDPAGASTFGADLIQHTRSELFPGICYKTNPDAIAYYPSIFWTHQQYSNTRPSADGKALEFMPVAERHYPADRWYASVDYSYLGIALGAGVGLKDSVFGAVMGGAVGYVSGRLIKVGNVILGTQTIDKLSVADMVGILDCTANLTKNVIYGGGEEDTLVGAASSDVLISGGMNGDHLSGGLGDDVYLVDVTNGGSVYISDSIGDDYIVVKNRSYYNGNGITALGYDRESDSFGFDLDYGRKIYLTQTLLRHKIPIVDENGNLLGVIDTRGDLNHGSERKSAEQTPICKEITANGPCQVEIYDSDGNLAGSFGPQTPGLNPTEFGTVYIGVDEEENMNLFTATVYADYTLKISGEARVDVAIVGTDDENYVNRVTQAEDVALSAGAAEVTPDEHLVTQGSETLTIRDKEKSVSVELDQTAVSLNESDSATIRAQAVFADGMKTDGVYFISEDPAVVACERGENGECVLTAVGGGETQIYAAAEDSGVYAVCRVSVAARKPVFTDVPEKAFYAVPVDWAVEHDITKGTSPTTFSPDATCTRGQVVTFLWRAEGSPEPSVTESPFTDVKSTKPAPFYFKSVLWAVENEITSGTSKTTFSPDAGCTRGQVVTFLWRTAGCPEPKNKENPFYDVKEGSFYYKAVLWAVENKITNGMSKTSFAPDATCTRGQIVTFLYRAMAKE